jgi:hypothetical protein
VELTIHEYLYKQPILYGVLISSQYGTGLLQTSPLKLLTSSPEPGHTVFQYHMVWRY